MHGLKVLTPIQKFYANKSVFVTGGSGFMGKVFLEKLLYSCSDVKKVYVLMRPKKGKGLTERVQEFSALPIFSRLVAENPLAIAKIEPIYGEMTQSKLGINDNDLKKLREKVNVIFHIAATVNFNVELKYALDLNMIGTQKVMDLAKEMSNLQSMVYVSTSFSACDQKVHEEKLYDWHLKPKQVLNAHKNNQLDRKMIYPFPNTYTYSKRVTELMIEEERNDLPITIVRPSIVTPTISEPFSGWIDNYNTVIGIITAAANGSLRTAVINRSNHIEYIPVDTAANGMLSAGWCRGIQTEKDKIVPIYNLTCTESSRITWGKCIDLLHKYVLLFPFKNTFWYPQIKVTTSPTINSVKRIFYQKVPGYIYDLLTLLTGKSGFTMTKRIKRQDAYMDSLEYFTYNRFDFKTSKLQALNKKMSPEDQKIFNITTDGNIGEKYIKDIVLGIRTYLMKQPIETLQNSQQKILGLRILDRALKITTTVGVLWMIPFDYTTLLENITI